MQQVSRGKNNIYYVLRTTNKHVTSFMNKKPTLHMLHEENININWLTKEKINVQQVSRRKTKRTTSFTMTNQLPIGFTKK